MRRKEEEKGARCRRLRHEADETVFTLLDYRRDREREIERDTYTEKETVVETERERERVIQNAPASFNY